jgi:murein DD-endopeptidase MepM/ murein hydrolase activator NlpD
MLWACFKRSGLVGLAALQLSSSAAHAQSRWQMGVFPVTTFQAYTSHFGTRSGAWGRVEPHYGLDIAAPMGSPIRNWWAGVVQDVIHDGACGVGLVIRSGNYEHIYCHLSGSAAGGIYSSGPVLLRQGQRLRTGQLIGHVGMSGRTTGPHLHWGMRHDGRWLDPAQILRAMAAGRRQQAARRAAPKAPPAPRVAVVR